MTNRPMITKTLSHLIETWWDATSRNWVTQIKDTEGNQIGDALFAGNKPSAKFNHSYALSIAAGLKA